MPVDRGHLQTIKLREQIPEVGIADHELQPGPPQSMLRTMWQIRLGSYRNPKVEIPEFGRNGIGAGCSSIEGGSP